MISRSRVRSHPAANNLLPVKLNLMPMLINWKDISTRRHWCRVCGQDWSATGSRAPAAGVLAAVCPFGFELFAWPRRRQLRWRQRRPPSRQRGQPGRARPQQQRQHLLLLPSWQRDSLPILSRWRSSKYPCCNLQFPRPNHSRKSIISWRNYRNQLTSMNAICCLQDGPSSRGQLLNKDGWHRSRKQLTALTLQFPIRATSALSWRVA